MAERMCSRQVSNGDLSKFSEGRALSYCLQAVGSCRHGDGGSGGSVSCTRAVQLLVFQKPCVASAV